MDRTPERRAELLGAAAAGELDDVERRELEAWAADDPSVAEEWADLAALSDRLDGIVWREKPPPPRLAANVVEGAGRGRSAGPVRRRVALLAAAVALVAAGAGGTIAVQSVAHAPPDGPPGTLGAIEQVEFEPDGAPAEVEAELVAHTWGTEAVLHVEGFEPGATYEVVFVDADGEEIGAGAFLGSKVPIDCRLNAAVLREDVRELQITRPDGTVLRAATVPRVEG